MIKMDVIKNFTADSIKALQNIGGADEIIFDAIALALNSSNGRFKLVIWTKTGVEERLQAKEHLSAKGFKFHGCGYSTEPIDQDVTANKWHMSY